MQIAVDAFAENRYLALTSLGSHVANAELPDMDYAHTNSYWDYLKIDALLQLQRGRENKGLHHHDEALFIIVHQVFELWFNLILHELRAVKRFLDNELEDVDGRKDAGSTLVAVNRVNRACTIMKIATQGFEVMETMDPVDFLEFRDYLTPASGFQSVQMREMEILLGLKESDRIEHNKCTYREAFVTGLVDKTPKFDKAIEDGSLRDSLYAWVLRLDIAETDQFFSDFMNAKRSVHEARLSELNERKTTVQLLLERKANELGTHASILNDLVRKEVRAVDQMILEHQGQMKWLNDFFEPTPEPGQSEKEAANQGRARKICLLLMTFATTPPAGREVWGEWAKVIDGLIQFEQMMLMWRHRHPRMVERMIGRRPGTGGSSGVDYLDSTAQYRVYRDLWNIRAIVIAPSKLPKFDISSA